MRGTFLLALLLAAFASCAQAEEGGLRDLCPDRPGKDTPPCIVDAGHLMVEVDALDVAVTRNLGVRQETTLALSPSLRFGLTDRLEAALNLVPFEQVRTKDAGAGTHSAVRGTGDTQFALKFSLRNPGGDGLSVALLPYVSLPTAQHGLGAGGFQGGVVLPVSLALPAGFSLGLSPEIDVLRSPAGGTHRGYQGAVSLGHALATGLNGSVELWSSEDLNPAGHVRQATFDLSLAWIPPRHANLQLDGGIDFGVSGQAPDLQAYVGVSRRF